MTWLIGVDIGTTNVKAAAVGPDGRLLARASRAIRTLSPSPGAAEQAPAAVLRRVVEVIREVVGAGEGVAGGGERAGGIVFSGAMHSLIALDARGRCLTNAWLWSDGRAAPFYRALRASEAGREIYRRTGTPVHSMSPLVKLICLREAYPEIAARARLYVGIKDYVLHRLVGEWICDASLASTTGLLSTASGEWDDAAVGAAGVAANQLPRVVSPTHVLRLTRGAAERLGLAAGLPVVAGGSDGAMANLGSGAVGPEKLAVSIATSAAVRLTVDTPGVDEAMRTFCYRLDDRRFIVGGASNNGGNVIDWLVREVFGRHGGRGGGAVARLLSEAGRIVPGSEGLLFAPYLHGERAPLWDTDAVAAFRGLTHRHGRGHLARAAVEGVVLNLRRIAEAMPRWAGCRSIVLSGGAAAHPLWQRIVADVFDRPVEVPAGDGPDASVLGALMLARDALGQEPLLPPKPALVLEPDAAGVQAYGDAFRRFGQLA